jgi:hypothetical protein
MSQNTRAANDAAGAEVERWEVDHPKPTSKRGIKRWWRKYHATHVMTDASWFALLDTETNFKKAQVAVAISNPPTSRFGADGCGGGGGL